ncbi:MAG: hypothetical protein AB1762_10970 [Gemmatimonadota bacterium]
MLSFSKRLFRAAWVRRTIASPGTAMLATAAVAFVMAVILTFGRGWPALGNVHDERSYLLAADTFSRGRLANPIPPFPESFETFHILVEPSYASKYPPAQGLILALGQRLTGEPIVGVWLSTALLAAALTWMLLGWFRLKWAVFGSMLLMLTLAAGDNMGYWMSTYWGGNVTATGAALLYGAVRRITRCPTPLLGAVFALGLGMLALSRPFEGFLASIPALIVVAHWLVRDRLTTASWRVTRVAAPAAAVMACFAAFFVLYNTRVTGHPLHMPYAEHEKQYSDVPIWAFEGSRTPVNHPNEELRRFYTEYKETSPWRSPTVAMKAELDRIVEIKRFLVPGLTLIFVVVALTSGLLRVLALPLAASGIVVGGALLTSWYFPHYISPMVAPWAIVLTAGAHRLWQMRAQGFRTGPMLVGLVLLVAVASAALAPIRLVAERRSGPAPWYVQQDSIRRALTSKGGQHLVIVQYGAEHDVDHEWVYNGAEFLKAPVIWARSLSSEKDDRLKTYFRDRVVWRVIVDRGKQGTVRLYRDAPPRQEYVNVGPHGSTVRSSAGVVMMPAAPARALPNVSGRSPRTPLQLRR